MRPFHALGPLALLVCGCGGGGGTSPFAGTWSGTGTLSNSSGQQLVVNAAMTMNVDSSGNVNGSDFVTLDGLQEIESGSITGSHGSLALAEGNAIYTVTASVSINSSGQLLWNGTETQGGTVYTVFYTLSKS